MIQTKGYAAQAPDKGLSPWNFERHDIGPHDVQIAIAYCGVCHTDLHQINNDREPGTFPMVPGHEIVRMIAGAGSHVKKFKAGNVAGVGVMVDSCRACEDCQNGQEQFCVFSPVQTSNSRDHDGLSAYGGYPNNIVANEDFTHRISEKLNVAAVAPLLCAGITTYSPLRRRSKTPAPDIRVRRQAPRLKVRKPRLDRWQDFYTGTQSK